MLVVDGEAHYTLADRPFNFHVLFIDDNPLPPPPSSPLTVSRWLTGHGQERGGLQVIMKNTSPNPLQLVYLESLPWYMKPYLHTLRATINGIPTTLNHLLYRPAIDRVRGTQLEIQLLIPSNTNLALTWEFDKSILRYTEYPPDANRGFDVA